MWCLIVTGARYAGLMDVGSDPSVVYLILASDVAQVITTFVERRNSQSPGLNSGAETVRSPGSTMSRPQTLPHAIFVVVIFGDDGTIYGAQIVGSRGVDKRIDTIAPSTGRPSSESTRPDTISPVCVGKMLYMTASIVGE